MRITTARLVLRDYVFDDWHDVLAYQRDPRYLRYYPWSDRTEDQAREFVQTFLDWREERPRRRFQFAIALPDDGRLIGSCGIRRKADSDREADIGYELAPGHWGRGYATEAALAVVEFGFRKLGLDRILSWCVADNTASARVLERVGLRLEYRLREDDYFKGHWWDALLYGLLESEWRASAVDQSR